MCDAAVLYANREPTEEELFYINQHSFDNAAAYAKSKGWKLIRGNLPSESTKKAEKSEKVEKLIEGKICPQCGALNDKYFQICGKCSTSLDGMKIVKVSESYGKAKELSEEERLEKRLQQIQKPSIITVILPLFLIPLGLAGMVVLMIEGGFFRIAFGLFAGLMLSVVGYGLFADNRDNYKLAQSDFDAYKRKVIAKQDADAKAKDPENIRKRQQEGLEREYQQAVASQQASEPWTVRYSTHPCPYCGHYKVRYAKWEDKQMSVAFWGIASSAIDKHYKCEYCKKMW